jgi:pimeloyl-ACP methyl ester carboxylesterase
MQAFVHGNPETTAIWTALVDELGRRGVDDIVLLSPPGFGAPTPEGWVPHRENYVRWLVGELDALGGEVDVVGHDWGAGHVFGVLAERPELVRTWAADCGGIGHPDYVWHDAAQGWQTPDVGEQMVQAMIDADPAGRAAMLAGLGLSKEAARDVAGAMNPEMGRCILGLYRSARQPAMVELGRQLAARAATLPKGLVIVAPDDPYVGTPAMADHMATLMGADTVTLAGQGHWWMFADLDTVASALVAHWAAA